MGEDRSRWSVRGQRSVGGMSYLLSSPSCVDRWETVRPFGPSVGPSVRDVEIGRGKAA